MAIVRHQGRAFLLPDNPNVGDTFVVSGRVWTWDGDKWVSTPVPALPGGTDTQIQFNDGGLFGGAAELVWDKTNLRLGVNMATALYALDVTGDANLNGTAPNPSYRINGIALAAPNANGTQVNLTNINSINGTAISALGTPGGADTQIQWNDNGAFGGSANFVWDDAGCVLTLDGDRPQISFVSRNQNAGSITADYDSYYIFFMADATMGISLATDAGNGSSLVLSSTTAELQSKATAALQLNPNGGNVGVAMAIPLYTFDVTGNVNLTDAAPATNNYAYRINGIPFAVPNTDGTTINLTNVTNINGAEPFTDPATTLGDLLVHDGTELVRLAVGTNGQVLLADSTDPLGVKWTAPPAATGDLIDITSITGNGTDPIVITGDTNIVGDTTITGDTNIDGALTVNNVPVLTDPTTTLGDLLIRGSTAVVRLPVGTDGQVLVSNSAASNGLGVTWTSPAAVSVPVTSVFTRTGDIVAVSGDYNATLITLSPAVATWNTVQDAITGLDTDVAWLLSEVTSMATHATVAGAAGQIQFHNGATPTAGFGASASLNWDNANSRLGIGTASPAYPLQVTGDANITGTPPAPAYRINGIAFATGNDATTVNLANVNNLSTVTLTINGTAFDPSALAFTADEIDLNPAVSTWTTVQDAVGGINSTLAVLARGMAYIGAYDAAGDVATFTTHVGIAPGSLPAADATGIHPGDYLVVTSATNSPAANANSTVLVVGDQLISDGTDWNRLPIGFAMAAITADMVPMNPVIGTWSTVQDAVTALNTMATPAGAAGQIQFHNGATPAAFGASANLTWNGTLNQLVVGLLSIDGLSGDIRIATAEDFNINSDTGSLGFSANDNLILASSGGGHVLIPPNVRIGSSSAPVYTLDVQGNINITDPAPATNNYAFRINGVPIPLPPTLTGATAGDVLTVNAAGTAMEWAALPSAAPVVGAAPATPTEGQMWFDTASMSMYIQIQGAWVGI